MIMRLKTQIMILRAFRLVYANSDPNKGKMHLLFSAAPVLSETKHVITNAFVSNSTIVLLVAISCARKLLAAKRGKRMSNH